MDTEQRAALRRIDRQFEAIRSMPRPIPGAERYRHGIEDVKVGGYLRAGGEAHRVVEISEYREKKNRWFELELFGLESGQTRTLEWEKDDEVEVTLNGPSMSLRELDVTADQIEEMSDEEEGTLQHQGRSFHYDDDYAASYHRGGVGEGERLHIYDFETRDERWCLTIEEWGSEDESYEYEAYLCEYLEPDQIEVLVLRGSDAG